MLLISESKIKQLLNMQSAIQISKQALLLASSGRAQIPLRMNMPAGNNGQFLFKPGYVEELNTAGIKIVSVFPKNIELDKPLVQAQMLLMNAQNGEIQAIINGTYLTQLRTGAVQGAATDLLAKKDAKTGVLIGTGGQASAQLEAMLNVRDLSEIWICGTNYEKTKLFVNKMQEEFSHYPTKIIPIKNCNEVIPAADIITAVTTSKKPVFDGNLVKKGTHINGIGSYTPDMQELPETIIQRADKIFFDTQQGVLAEAGDFIIPLQKNVINQININGELGDLLSGKVQGRENEQEITLFKSVGTAVLDVVTAFHIYGHAKAQRIDEEIYD